jgi:asparagine synthase (glutamine-hydrolysing)
MCGLFGHTGLKTEANLDHSHESLHCLTHRGPDGWHYHAVNDVYLGHRRLSILDLSEQGRQPMSAHNVHITVNGEIYNFQTLRTELEGMGYIFNSHSDSEVVLHGYHAWGIESLLDRMDGMFALAIYDATLDKIYLARDHVGIKPLYYGLKNQHISWASELKALTHFYGAENLKIEPTALYDFLTYLYIPCPKTLYKDIYKLEPAHYLIFNLKTHIVETHRYWSLDDVMAAAISHSDNIRDVLAQSIREQLVSDVPVGFFLSGGIDSSTVCFEAAQQIQNMHSFSIGNVDPNNDETEYAKMVADQIGATHHTDVFHHDLANKNFELLRILYDEPFADVSAFPTYQVCCLAKQNVTVVLTGDGGDELFGGYGRYLRADEIFNPPTSSQSDFKNQWIELCLAIPVRKIQRKARKNFFSVLNDPMARWTYVMDGMIANDPAKKAIKKQYHIPDDYDDYWYYRQYDRPDLPSKTRAQYLDFHTYMHDSVLTKVDRASMRVAIETRVPFLSKAMISAAWRYRDVDHYKDGQLKSILKQAYRGLLPDVILDRRKQGFAVGRTRKTDRLHHKNTPLPLQILNQLYTEIPLS